ncbi:hypothetical protein LCGC14_0788610 [marine sediment metagenome]|uniref:Uncharacterized protein n=1 Tax=marine sediment metagenome TaxID=412755 RepID=A0A0F9PTB5_9ZZZZ
MEELKKGICRTCGEVMVGATRGFVDGQFSMHNEERHSKRLDAGEALIIEYFEGEAPVIQRERVDKSEVLRKREREVEATAVWV